MAVNPAYFFKQLKSFKLAPPRTFDIDVSNQSAVVFSVTDLSNDRNADFFSLGVDGATKGVHSNGSIKIWWTPVDSFDVVINNDDTTIEIITAINTAAGIAVAPIVAANFGSGTGRIMITNTTVGPSSYVKITYNSGTPDINTFSRWIGFTNGQDAVGHDITSPRYVPATTNEFGVKAIHPSEPISHDLINRLAVNLHDNTQQLWYEFLFVTLGIGIDTITPSYTYGETFEFQGPKVFRDRITLRRGVYGLNSSTLDDMRTTSFAGNAVLGGTAAEIPTWVLGDVLKIYDTGGAFYDTVLLVDRNDAAVVGYGVANPAAPLGGIKFIYLTRGNSSTVANFDAFENLRDGSFWGAVDGTQIWNEVAPPNDLSGQPLVHSGEYVYKQNKSTFEDWSGPVLDANHAGAPAEIDATDFSLYSAWNEDGVGGSYGLVRDRDQYTDFSGSGYDPSADANLVENMVLELSTSPNFDGIHTFRYVVRRRSTTPGEPFIYHDKRDFDDTTFYGSEPHKELYWRIWNFAGAHTFKTHVRIDQDLIVNGMIRPNWIYFSSINQQAAWRQFGDAWRGNSATDLLFGTGHGYENFLPLRGYLRDPVNPNANDYDEYRWGIYFNSETLNPIAENTWPGVGNEDNPPNPDEGRDRALVYYINGFGLAHSVQRTYIDPVTSNEVFYPGPVDNVDFMWVDETMWSSHVTGPSTLTGYNTRNRSILEGQPSNITFDGRIKGEVDTTGNPLIMVPDENGISLIGPDCGQHDDKQAAIVVTNLGHGDDPIATIGDDNSFLALDHSTKRSAFFKNIRFERNDNEIAFSGTRDATTTTPNSRHILTIKHLSDLEFENCHFKNGWIGVEDPTLLTDDLRDKNTDHRQGRVKFKNCVFENAYLLFNADYIDIDECWFLYTKEGEDLVTEAGMKHTNSAGVDILLRYLNGFAFRENFKFTNNYIYNITGQLETYTLWPAPYVFAEDAAPAVFQLYSKNNNVRINDAAPPGLFNQSTGNYPEFRTVSKIDASNSRMSIQIFGNHGSTWGGGSEVLAGNQKRIGFGIFQLKHLSQSADFVNQQRHIDVSIHDNIIDNLSKRFNLPNCQLIENLGEVLLVANSVVPNSNGYNFTTNDLGRYVIVSPTTAIVGWPDALQSKLPIRIKNTGVPANDVVDLGGGRFGVKLEVWMPREFTSSGPDVPATDSWVNIDLVMLATVIGGLPIPVSITDFDGVPSAGAASIVSPNGVEVTNLAQTRFDSKWIIPYFFMYEWKDNAGGGAYDTAEGMFANFNIDVHDNIYSCVENFVYTKLGGVVSNKNTLAPSNASIKFNNNINYNIMPYGMAKTFEIHAVKSIGGLSVFEAQNNFLYSPISGWMVINNNNSPPLTFGPDGTGSVPLGVMLGPLAYGLLYVTQYLFSYNVLSNFIYSPVSVYDSSSFNVGHPNSLTNNIITIDSDGSNGVINTNWNLSSVAFSQIRRADLMYVDGGDQTPFSSFKKASFNNNLIVGAFRGVYYKFTGTVDGMTGVTTDPRFTPAEYTFDFENNEVIFPPQFSGASPLITRSLFEVRLDSNCSHFTADRVLFNNNIVKRRANPGSGDVPNDRPTYTDGDRSYVLRLEARSQNFAKTKPLAATLDNEDGYPFFKNVVAANNFVENLTGFLSYGVTLDIDNAADPLDKSYYELAPLVTQTIKTNNNSIINCLSLLSLPVEIDLAAPVVGAPPRLGKFEIDLSNNTVTNHGKYMVQISGIDGNLYTPNYPEANIAGPPFYPYDDASLQEHYHPQSSMFNFCNNNITIDEINRNAAASPEAYIYLSLSKWNRLLMPSLIQVDTKFDNNTVTWVSGQYRYADPTYLNGVATVNEQFRGLKDFIRFDTGSSFALDTVSLNTVDALDYWQKHSNIISVSFNNNNLLQSNQFNLGGNSFEELPVAGNLVSGPYVGFLGSSTAKLVFQPGSLIKFDRTAGEFKTDIVKLTARQNNILFYGMTPWYFISATHDGTVTANEIIFFDFQFLNNFALLSQIEHLLYAPSEAPGEIKLDVSGNTLFLTQRWDPTAFVELFHFTGHLVWSNVSNIIISSNNIAVVNSQTNALFIYGLVITNPRAELFNADFQATPAALLPGGSNSVSNIIISDNLLREVSVGHIIANQSIGAIDVPAKFISIRRNNIITNEDNSDILTIHSYPLGFVAAGTATHIEVNDNVVDSAFGTNGGYGSFHYHGRTVANFKAVNNTVKNQRGGLASFDFNGIGVAGPTFIESCMLTGNEYTMQSPGAGAAGLNILSAPRNSAIYVFANNYNGVGRIGDLIINNNRIRVYSNFTENAQYSQDDHFVLHANLSAGASQAIENLSVQQNTFDWGEYPAGFAAKDRAIQIDGAGAYTVRSCRVNGNYHEGHVVVNFPSSVTVTSLVATGNVAPESGLWAANGVPNAQGGPVGPFGSVAVTNGVVAVNATLT